MYIILKKIRIFYIIKIKYAKIDKKVDYWTCVRYNRIVIKIIMKLGVEKMNICEVKDNYNLFVKINYKSGDDKVLSKIKTHLNNKVLGERYLIGGGILNRKGSTLILKINSIEDIKEISSEKDVNYKLLAVPKILN